ncbi:WXG100 family type VII secretion target [Streptosporangium canum]|uniref:WXG100 family type VII secretion target n=1 Tax=Streptosporangium canum TaxID=324952 RepID=UPI00343729FB
MSQSTDYTGGGFAADYTKVNFVQMERVQGELLQVVTAMDTVTDNLITQLRATLGEASWSGGASEFFEQHRAKWDQAEQEMGRQLNEAAKALGVATENYRAAEQRNKAIWSG